MTQYPPKSKRLPKYWAGAAGDKTKQSWSLLSFNTLSRRVGVSNGQSRHIHDAAHRGAGREDVHGLCGAEQLAEITVMAAEEMMRLGIKPKAALQSHSNFGSSDQHSAVKMRKTMEMPRMQAP